MKENILNFSFDELEEKLTSLIDYRFRILQVFTSMQKKYKTDFNDFIGIPKELKDKLSQNFVFPYFNHITTTKSEDGTRKFLFEISGNKTSGKSKIETVLISEDNRNTICVSTQAGCNVGCEFCATGKMGLLKNLDVSQILLQIYNVSKLAGIKPTNLVFMGMGEPFLNYDNLLKSLKILTDKRGFGISSKRITVSTVGLKTKINLLAGDLVKEENNSLRNIKLALSLHSTNQGIRESIIPVAKNNRLPDLYKEIADFYKITGNKITYEYIFFPGINDSNDDISRIEKLSKMVPCNFNIIPFHQIGKELKPPLDIYNIDDNKNKGMHNSLLIKKLNYLITILKSKKVVVNLRSSSGTDINAACGQLATVYKELK